MKIFYFKMHSPNASSFWTIYCEQHILLGIEIPDFCTILVSKVNCAFYQGCSDPDISHSLLHVTEVILWSVSAPFPGKCSCPVILCAEYFSPEPDNYLRKLAASEADSCTFNSEKFSCYDKTFPQLSLSFLSRSLPHVIFVNHNFHFMWCITINS